MAYDTDISPPDSGPRANGRWPLFAGLAILVFHLVGNPLFRSLDQPLLGFLYVIDERFAAEAASEVVLVEADDKSLRAIPDRFPWSRKIFATGIVNLAAAQPAAILFDFSTPNPTGSDPAADEALATAIRKSGRVVLTYSIGEIDGRLLRMKPYAPFQKAAAATGHHPVIADPSLPTGTCQMASRLDGTWSFATPLEAIRVARDLPYSALHVRERSLVLRSKGKSLRMRTDAHLRGEVDLSAVARIPRISFLDVWKNKFSSGTVAGKIVVIGATGRIGQALVPSPIGPPLAPTELIAASIESCLQDTLRRRPPDTLIAFLLLTVGALLVVMGKLLGGKRGALAAGGAMTVWWFSAVLAFLGEGLVLPLARPTSMFVSLAALALLQEMRGADAPSQSAVGAHEEAARLLQLGIRLLERGAADDALKYFRKAAALGTDQKPEAQAYLALGLVRAGQAQTGAQLLNEIDFADIPAELSYSLATSFEGAGELKRAQTVFERIRVNTTGFRDVDSRLEAIRHQMSSLDDREIANMIVQRVISPRYRNVELIGSGGMGYVFRANDAESENQVVALKAVSPYFANQPEIHTRFVREAQLIATIDHPNIVKVFDVFPVNLPYYTMEFLVSKELADIVKERGHHLPESEVLDLALQTCAGLSCAHDRGIVHRDLKPANLMVDEDGLLKVIDFGIAKFTGETQLTQTGARMGTPRYMSPEQARGMEVDHRTDIYTLGLIMHELIDGDLPIATATQRMTEDLRPPIRATPGFAAIIAKCHARYEDERFATIAEVRTALEDLAK